ncbi:MAG: hypothetical protein U0794_06960 [Isosphaeraceae bacterium]
MQEPTLNPGDGFGVAVGFVESDVIVGAANPVSVFPALDTGAAYDFSRTAALGLSTASSAEAAAPGASINLSGTFLDPGVLDFGALAVPDALHPNRGKLVVNWGDGATSVLTPSQSATHFNLFHAYTTTNPGGFNITATVVDKDDAVSVATTHVNISGTGLYFTPAGIVFDSSTINEGGQARLSGAFVDPDPTHTHTVAINWGDGSPAQLLSLPAGVTQFQSVAHLYKDNLAGNAAYQVSATVSDYAGGIASASTTLSVLNVAPTIPAGGLIVTPGAISEGGQINLAGLFADPGVQDGHVVTIDWGDGTSSSPDVTTLQLLPGAIKFNAPHTYLDNPAANPLNGAYTITVRVRDKDQSSTAPDVAVATTTAVVNDLAPKVAIVDDQALTIEGITPVDPVTPGVLGQVVLKANVTDPGPLDTTFTYQWFAQGIGPNPSSLSSQAPQLFLPTGYIWVVTLQVSDKDGLIGADKALIITGSSNNDLIRISDNTNTSATPQVTVVAALGGGPAVTTIDAAGLTRIVGLGLARLHRRRCRPPADRARRRHRQRHHRRRQRRQPPARRPRQPAHPRRPGQPLSDPLGGASTCPSADRNDILVSQHGATTPSAAAAANLFVVVPGSDTTLDATNPVGTTAGMDTIDFSAHLGVTSTSAPPTSRARWTRAGRSPARPDFGTFQGVLGSTQADKFIANNAGDMIAGGGGNDVIVGGSGGDLLFAGTISLPVQGDGNHHRRRLDRGRQGQRHHLRRRGNDTVQGGGGNDDHRRRQRQRHHLRRHRQRHPAQGSTGGGNTSIVGGSGNDLIFSAAGNDTIAGGTGSSTIVGGSGNDIIFAGGLGNDTTQGSTGGNGNA